MRNGTSRRILGEIMAFVPYVANFRFIPTTSSSSFRSLPTSTPPTYVYSKPVPASYSSNTMFVQPQPKRLDVHEGVSPGLFLRVSI